jgi:hypothetical protein
MTQTLRALRSAAWLAAVGSLLACSNQGQAASTPPTPSTDSVAAAPPPASAATPESPRWLVVDTAARVATLELGVTAPPGAPSALINGYRAGEARIVLPLDWTLKWNWRSSDSTAPHSLVVMAQREKIPLEGGRAAFSNAMTRMVTEGLRPGQTDQTTFVADEAGWYWMLCGVPGHAIKGEWLELRVDPEAKTARVEVKGVRGEGLGVRGQGPGTA